jgi:hypothetical protein
MKTENSSRRSGLQRWLAAFLLFLFLQDIGFHLAESLLEGHDDSTLAAFRASSGAPLPLDPDGCGIPEHDDTPFHHHHFPAVVTQPSLALAPSGFAWLYSVSTPENEYTACVLHTGRSPPPF